MIMVRVCFVMGIGRLKVFDHAYMSYIQGFKKRSAIVFWAATSRYFNCSQPQLGPTFVCDINKCDETTTTMDI